MLEALAILAAGGVAGAINVIVGSGTLITFPVLLAVGYPPVVANISNTVGLVPGSVAGAVGYRRELAGQRPRAVRLAIASAVGGATGAVSLIVLPAEAFESIVPAFITAALILVIVQPRLVRRLARRPRALRGRRRAAAAAVFVAGVYGGYFGAAQGILLLATLGVAEPDDVHRLNALKNVLAGVVNAVAATVFVIVDDVAWQAALLVALGAVVGGHAGARFGRHLAPNVLRSLIIVVGVCAVIGLVT